MGFHQFLRDCCWVAFLFLVSAGGVSANVTVPVPFGNHMVLQRGKQVPIWGTASASEVVSVTFNGQTKSVTANASGNWSLKLDAMSAGGPFTMTIVGKNTITFTDVMVGEVWHCAGQSNMDTRMNYTEYPNLKDSIPLANFPLLRYITMRQPGQTIQWQQVNPTSVASMTATGYFFGRELLANLQGVAVGILNTSVGGTTIEQWMDPATVSAVPALQGDAKASTMYNEWVKPVVGYAIKGTVWLQGENNTGSGLAPSYGARLREMIPGWKKVWSQTDMPFIVAGLSHKGGVQTAAGEASNQAIIREGQRLVTDTLDNTTWLSVLIDLGADATWHYPQKSQAGRRLGKVARALVYGQTGFPYLSPKPIACFHRGSQIIIPFDRKGSSLQWSSNTAPYGFEVAGSNNVWSWATGAELRGDTVILTTNVANPTQVRHAWANQPIIKLWTKDGLPAEPFRMDIGGEPVPPVVISTKLQEDLNCGMDGVLESTNLGFEGTGYLNFNNVIQSSTGFAFQVDTVPLKPTWFRYSNGGAANRPLSISINGVSSGVELDFPPTGSWTTWNMVSAMVPWKQGRDSLVLISLVADGGPNLDWIGFQDGKVKSTQCQQSVPLMETFRYGKVIRREKLQYFNLLGARTEER